MTETESGNFESAWRAYEAFFAHPRRNFVHIETFARCFYFKHCPGIGVLGALLDKTPEDAAAFWSFCPDWPAMYPDEVPDKLEEFRRVAESLVAAALGAPCSEWGSHHVRLLEEQPQLNSFLPQIIALVPTDRAAPSIDIEVNGRALTAMVDTGSTSIVANARGFAHEHDGLEYLSWSSGTYGLRTLEPKAVPLARLDEVRVGAETFKRLLATVLNFHIGDKPVPADQKNIIGMNFLLKYGSVCFDWVKQLVYLGAMGPCKGVASSTARFDGSLSFEVHVGGKRNPQAFALIDTGSDVTYCSAWFIKERSNEFNFASKLKGRCLFDEDIRFQDLDTGGYQVVIGMDTLLQFAAFGWELNPFRVYFVPKETGETAPASEEPIAAAPGHRLDGSAGQAVHRRGPRAEAQPEEVLTRRNP